VGDGYVYGIEVGGAYALNAHWSVFGNSTFMEGKVDTFPTSEPDREKEYIDRLMPMIVQLGVHWEDPDMGLWSELAVGVRFELGGARAMSPLRGCWMDGCRLVPWAFAHG